MNTLKNIINNLNLESHLSKLQRLIDTLKTNKRKWRRRKCCGHLAVLFRYFLCCLFSFTCSLSMFMYRRRCIRNWDWRCRETNYCNIRLDRAWTQKAKGLMFTCLFCSSASVRGHRTRGTSGLVWILETGCDLSGSHGICPLSWNSQSQSQITRCMFGV